MRDDMVVIEYEDGIGNVRLASGGTWPARLILHFAPPFHRGFESIGATVQNEGRDSIPHQLLEASESHGVSYELDTSGVSGDSISVGWIDAFRR